MPAKKRRPRRLRPGRAIGSGARHRRSAPTKSGGMQMLVLREALADEISKVIVQRDLTQMEAAEIAGDAASQISLLMCGRLEGFSVERLLRTLVRLGQNVDLVLRPTPGLRAGKLRVRHGSGRRG